MRNPTRMIPKGQPNTGFALVVMLTLMALLSVLSLGMLSIASVSLRESSHADPASIARANARLALTLAISEIQKNTGPDQRVTARADLIDENSPNPSWTAVWNSAGGAPAFLVSGNERAGFDLGSASQHHPAGYVTHDQPLDTASSIALLEPGLPQEEGVRAPLVPIRGDREGTYAYWVSDEGVKARFNTANPYLPAGPFPDKQLAASIAQSNSARHASGELMDTWAQGASNVQHAISMEQGQFLVSAVDGFARSYFHHLTPYSRGLLTNTKNGGLKRDLTLAFENDDVFLRWFGRDRFAHHNSQTGITSEGGYALQGSPEKFFISDAFLNHSGGKEVGPNWGTMSHFHSLYKKDKSTFHTIFPHPLDGIQIRRSGWNPYTQHMDPGDTSASLSTDHQHTNSFVAPVPGRVQASFRLGAVSVGINDQGIAEYDVRLEFKPLVGLWNPYNVRFSPNRYRMDWEMSPVLEIEINTGGSIRTTRIDLIDWYGKHSVGGYIDLILNNRADLQAGEFRMFSITDPIDLPPGNYKSNSSDVTGRLIPTWGANGYFRMVLPFDGAPLTAEEKIFKPLRVPEGSTVKVLSLSLSERAISNYADSAGNFLTLKPDRPDSTNKDSQGRISTFRSTNLWQPSEDGSETGATPERITDMPPQDVSELSSASQELGTWAFALRTTDSNPGQNIRNLIDSNVRAANHNSRWDGSIDGDGMTTISAFKGEGPEGRGLLEPGGGAPQADATGQRYRMFGGNGNETHNAVFDIPHARPLSLGAFQHANLARYGNEPSFIVGNSYANIRVPLDEKINPDFLASSGNGLTTFDICYLINENIWDGYFLSGLSPNPDLPDTLFTAIARGEHPAPNARISVLDPTPPKSDVLSPASPFAEEIAGKLAVEGAFNINSTSVEAWRAVLAGMAEIELPTFDPITNGPTSWEKSGGVTFSRFSRNPGEENDFWMGYLSLDDEQLDALAIEIVNQIRVRGPFRNLGDFVNRSLTPAPATYTGSDIRESGTLQTALDHPDVMINANLPTGVSSDAVNLTGSQFLPILNGKPKAAGQSGFILQGDILQAIAPIITPRSDTFLIRAYGDAIDRNGTVTARAWCEAVVQRSPEYMDPIDPPRAAPNPGDTLIPAVSSEMNKRFGRKFDLVSFRWLNPNEI